MNRLILYISFIFFGFLFLTTSVEANSWGGQTLAALEEGTYLLKVFDMEKIYANYGPFIDFLVVLALLMAVFRHIPQIKDKLGPKAANIIAIALAVSVFGSSYATGFRLINLSPYIAFFSAMILAYSLYNITKGTVFKDQFWLPFSIALFIFGNLLLTFLTVVV